MKTLFVALLIGMNLLWAGSYAIFKVLGEHIDSGSIATIRFAIAALCLIAAWPWLPGKGPQAREWLRVFAMGVIVFCIAPRLQVEAVHLGKAGDTSLLMALDPLLTAFAAALFLREKVPARRWWGCGVGMLGVVLLSRIWQGDMPLKGLLANTLFILSMVCETFYSVIGKPLLEKSNPMKLVGAALVSGTVVNVCIELGKPGANAFQAVQTMPLSAWMWLIYLAVVCTVVGYTLWFLVIRETEVNIAGLTVLMQPMAGWLLSVFWLKESFHSGQFWGAAAIVAGLAIGLTRGSTSKSETLRPVPLPLQVVAKD
ncbi:MAG: eamA [Verrucomicrobiales bacterium]|nr:eamA [Verrucomicrobiales bacterium]